MIKLNEKYRRKNTVNNSNSKKNLNSSNAEKPIYT